MTDKKSRFFILTITILLCIFLNIVGIITLRAQASKYISSAGFVEGGILPQILSLYDEEALLQMYITIFYCLFMSNWNFIFLFCFIAYWSQALLWSLGKRKRLLFLQAPGCWVTLPNSWTRGSSGKHFSRACGSSFFLSSIPLGLSSVCLDWFSLATNFTSQLQELFSKSQCTRPLFSFPCCCKNIIYCCDNYLFSNLMYASMEPRRR